MQMEMLMQLWRLEPELDGVNSGNWYQCIPTKIISLIMRGRPRSRPKKTCTEVVQKDSQACKLKREDAMDCSTWRKQIKDD